MLQPAAIVHEGYQTGVYDANNGSDIFDWAASFFGGTPITTTPENTAPLLGTQGDDIFVGSSPINVVSYQDATTSITVDLGILDRQATGAGNDAFVNVGTLLGSDYADTLTASSTGSNLSGGGGDDVLRGDVSVLNGDDGADVIYAGPRGLNAINGGADDDQIHLSPITGFGPDTVDGGDGNDVVFLTGLRSEYEFHRGDGGQVVATFNNGSSSYTLGSISNVETITFGDATTFTPTELAGSYGTAGDDTALLGTAGNDFIYGLAGDDTMYGGSGNDQYFGGDGFDLVDLDGALPDYVFARLETGAVQAVHITDGSIATVIGVEAFYFVGSGESATTNSLVGDFGTPEDDASIAGTSHGDQLYGLQGNDVIVGDSGNDLIVGGDGNDTLQGGGDADSMYGGSGDDYYYVDNIGDVVSEQTTADVDDGGWDQVEASISYTLPSYLEEVDLLGATNINATGNDLDNYIYGNTGNNILFGLAGNDTLDASAGGRDTLAGGDGDDIYWITNASDVITETNSSETGGWDDVWSSVSYTLPTNVEELDLLGSSNLNGTGNAIDNFLFGNNGSNVLSGLGGNDTLVGNAGNDTLNGGTGADTFAFAAAGSANGVDNVQDFVHGTDILQFTGADYGFAVGHTLTSSEFTVGSAAVGSSAQFVWNSMTHTLYFDDDGAGGGAAIAIAAFGGSATLTASDFHFV